MISITITSSSVTTNTPFEVLLFYKTEPQQKYDPDTAHAFRKQTHLSARLYVIVKTVKLQIVCNILQHKVELCSVLNDCGEDHAVRASDETLVPPAGPLFLLAQYGSQSKLATLATAYR